jgi:hypothetical protein
MKIVYVLGFVASFSFFAIVYGVSSTVFGLFPADLVLDTIYGVKTWKDTLKEELARKLPANAIAEFSGTPGPIVSEDRNSRSPRDELILMTGGPYQYLDVCPKFGCAAWIMERSGKVLHSWPIQDLDEWAGRGGTTIGVNDGENTYSWDARVYDNGDLLVLRSRLNAFPYGGGFVKLDKDGNIQSRQDNFAHHWFHVGSDGLIYAPSSRIGPAKIKLPDSNIKIECHFNRRMVLDTIVVLNSELSPVKEIDLLDVFVKSGYSSFLQLSRQHCDLFHLNSVRVLSEDLAQEYPSLSAGDFLLSIPRMNSVAVIDPNRERVKWLGVGLTTFQHSPRFIGDNKIMAIDNLGGSAKTGGTRIVSIDLGTKEVTTVFPTSSSFSGDVLSNDAFGPSLFFHVGAGNLSLSKDKKRVFLADGGKGQLLEIDVKTGDVLWGYINSHNIKVYGTQKGVAKDIPEFARFPIFSGRVIEKPQFLSDTIQ